MCLLFSANALANDCSAPGEGRPARIARVIDGDTVRLTNGRSLRLIGLDAPELGREGRADQAGARPARNTLQALLAAHDNRVRLVHDRERQDRYGRSLAHLHTPDGHNINAELLRRGRATLLTIPPNIARLRCYQAAQAEALREARGLWALPAYRSRPAQSLTPSDRGYARIHGRVSRAGRGGNALWLQLAPGVALRIAEADLDHFPAGFEGRIAGRQVEARGWLYRRQGELRMNIRHPSALRPD